MEHGPTSRAGFALDITLKRLSTMLSLLPLITASLVCALLIAWWSSRIAGRRSSVAISSFILVVNAIGIAYTLFFFSNGYVLDESLRVGLSTYVIPVCVFLSPAAVACLVSQVVLGSGVSKKASLVSAVIVSTLYVFVLPYIALLGLCGLAGECT